MALIAARQTEIAILRQVLEARQASFVAVYGRRRVGKTYLVREFFQTRSLYLEAIGIKDGSLADQLQIFHEAMQRTFHHGLPIQRPRGWREAFAQLTQALQQAPKDRKIVVFLDELPWLATRRSGLLQQLEHFWNSYWSSLNNVVLVVCGSAASWVLDKLIHAKGGLHNRLTHTISLKPFTPLETRDYLAFRGVKMAQAQVLDLHLAVGGVPFYLDQVARGQSAAQAINSACFGEHALLFGEFSRLFASLFDDSELYERIVRTLVRRRSGLPRAELVKLAGLSSGGRAYKRLAELEESGFLASATPYGRANDFHYRVIDEFVWFHFNWIDRAPKGLFRGAQTDYWLKQLSTPRWLAWGGYAYESVWLKNAACLARALEIGSINYQVGQWRHVSGKGEREGAQIDLLFDRDDGVISICEIKFNDKPFTIDRAYAAQLQRKLETFERVTKTNKSLSLVMVTKNGLKPNAWSEALVAQTIGMGALFATSGASRR